MNYRCIHKGFTLVELLVALALLSLMSVLLVSITNSTASTWKYTTGKIEQFRGASNAFDSMTRRVSQATLNTYWDYHYPNNDATKPPDSYIRQSELRFISGQAETLTGTTQPHRPTDGIFFQAPLGFVDDPANFGGMENLLNTWGYYVEFNKDTRPTFINNLPHPPPTRWRYRLMELMQPSNKMSLYSYTSGTGRYQSTGIANNLIYTSANPPGGYTGLEWFTDAVNAPAPPVHVLAENVICLVLLPKLSTAQDSTGTQLCPNYSYDSTKTNDANDPSSSVQANLNWQNQLPPVVQVTMVAIDEASANRVASGSNPPAFDSNLLVANNYFTKAGNFDSDLQSLQNTLSAQHINYRVFTSNVSIRAAKWSRY